MCNLNPVVEFQAAGPHAPWPTFRNHPSRSWTEKRLFWRNRAETEPNDERVSGFRTMDGTVRRCVRLGHVLTFCRSESAGVPIRRNVIYVCVRFALTPLFEWRVGRGVCSVIFVVDFFFLVCRRFEISSRECGYFCIWRPSFLYKGWVFFDFFLCEIVIVDRLSKKCENLWKNKLRLVLIWVQNIIRMQFANCTFLIYNWKTISFWVNFIWKWQVIELIESRMSLCIKIYISIIVKKACL